MRIKLIELLERDDYEQMPQSVFIMGYLRAYAKLLSVDAEPYIAAFNRLYTIDKNPEKALWQGRRETHSGERLVRWISALIVLTALIIVSLWWHKNNTDDKQHASTPEVTTSSSTKSEAEQGPRLTELAKLRSLFVQNATDKPVEMQSG